MKKRVALIFGGKSAEHEVSIHSARAVFNHIDRNKFVPFPLFINRQGSWIFHDENFIEEKDLESGNFQSFLPWEVIDPKNTKFDIAFPVLHGPNGEDGKIQGLFEMAGLPYVGADSFSSALAMDKIVSKILFRRNGLKTADFIETTREKVDRAIVEAEINIGFPCFVKPCSLGSSVGISRATEINELRSAINKAFEYDMKVIIEKEIKGKEIEVSIMGNSEIIVSRPGSFIPSKEFYDYEDKYILGKTEFFIPAVLEKSIEEKIREHAKTAYKALYLNGFARVDFFLEEGTNEVIINEINTIPGFTEISMFPKLWEPDGIGFTELITRLIAYGFEQFEKTGKLKLTP